MERVSALHTKWGGNPIWCVPLGHLRSPGTVNLCFIFLHGQCRFSSSSSSTFPDKSGFATEHLVKTLEPLCGNRMGSRKLKQEAGVRNCLWLLFVRHQDKDASLAESRYLCPKDELTCIKGNILNFVETSLDLPLCSAWMTANVSVKSPRHFCTCWFAHGALRKGAFQSKTCSRCCVHPNKYLHVSVHIPSLTKVLVICSNSQFIPSLKLLI